VGKNISCREHREHPGNSDSSLNDSSSNSYFLDGDHYDHDDGHYDHDDGHYDLDDGHYDLGDGHYDLDDGVAMVSMIVLLRSPLGHSFQ